MTFWETISSHANLQNLKFVNVTVYHTHFVIYFLKLEYCKIFDRCLATQATYDLVIVGGGIIGLGTARELILRHPTLKLALVEKETELCELKTCQIVWNNNKIFANLAQLILPSLDSSEPTIVEGGGEGGEAQLHLI